jgi:type IV secretory pathway protease TraF
VSPPRLPRWEGWALGLAVLAAGGAVRPPLFLINESASLPRGLYVRWAGPPALGAIVAARPPRAGLAYLASLGAPADLRILKRLAARPGDRVCARHGRVATPLRTVVQRRRDLRGAPLPVWTQCRALGPGEAFLLGDSALSFDSRAFGPVGRIEGVYRPVLTW